MPKITLRRVDLIDARMEGRNCAFNDLDLTLREMTFQNGDWSAQDGSLSFNANDLINGSVHLTDTLANMTFSPQGVEIPPIQRPLGKRVTAHQRALAAAGS
ncbi:MAG: hypothetical protein ACR5LG_03975 [Sodalis sp. (in: enterobacteria)]